MINIPHIALPPGDVHIIQVGAGGNGGYLVQRLSKMIYAYQQITENISYEYTLYDGDIVTHANLHRQPFIEEDVGEFKVKVLAERYGNTYGIPIYYRDAYVESTADLFQCIANSLSKLNILVGCVDNHATRKILHQFFYQKQGNLIYLDSGVDSVLPDDNMSGYSGVVVCGVKLDGKIILPPVADVYPDILADVTSKLPTESCGENAVNYPQRMMTNEMAAIVMAGYLNNILGNRCIVSHYTNFNAMTMKCNPVYIKRQQLSA